VFSHKRCLSSANAHKRMPTVRDGHALSESLACQIDEEWVCPPLINIRRPMRGPNRSATQQKTPFGPGASGAQKIVLFVEGPFARVNASEAEAPTIPSSSCNPAVPHNFWTAAGPLVHLPAVVIGPIVPGIARTKLLPQAMPVISSSCTRFVRFLSGARPIECSQAFALIPQQNIEDCGALISDPWSLAASPN